MEGFRVQQRCRVHFPRFNGKLNGESLMLQLIDIMCLLLPMSTDGGKCIKVSERVTFRMVILSQCSRCKCHWVFIGIGF